MTLREDVPGGGAPADRFVARLGTPAGPGRIEVDELFTHRSRRRRPGSGLARVGACSARFPR